MAGEWAADRTVLRISGADARKFLQDLVTNDVEMPGLVYAALLTPQGKYLFDFFLQAEGDSFLLDIQSARAAALAQRLNMYRLRADVKIEEAGLFVNRGLGNAPDGAHSDPRNPALGWRSYARDKGGAAQIDWAAIRVTHCIPETGIELLPDNSYILEAGFEALSGVDFRKGCYVGQEVTARMKHKTELRKGLRGVTVKGEAPVGSEIKVDGKLVGTLFSQSGGKGIAFLRLDRVREGMMADGAGISL
ncbi:MAG: folate-binding protein [Rhodobacteraceae bacterium]|nr:folate-binding protein [Paracoccaceae bacterium]